MDKSIDQMITEETTERLKEMSDPSYVFPEKATKWDYLGIAVAINACLVFIILCMTGVIA
jgi:hypothetical protein